MAGTFGDSLVQEETLVVSFAALPVSCLARVAAVSKNWHSCSQNNFLWKLQCERRWRSKIARYHLTPERCSQIERETSFSSWAQEFSKAEADAKRCAITSEELTVLSFTFTNRQGSSASSVQGFRFGSDGLTYGHPSGRSLSWQLAADGKSVTVHLNQVAVALVHVGRCRDWSWRLSNTFTLLLEDTAEAGTDLVDIAELFVSDTEMEGHREAEPEGRLVPATEGPYVDISELSEEDAIGEIDMYSGTSLGGGLANAHVAGTDVVFEVEVDGEMEYYNLSDMYYGSYNH